MKNKYEKLIEALADLSPRLRSSLIAENEYWKPDAPPMTIVLTTLGGEIFSEMKSAAPSMASVFLVVEDAMKDEDPNFVEVVGTGFLEAIAHQAYKDAVCQDLLLKNLGEKSSVYVRRWMSLDA